MHLVPGKFYLPDEKRVVALKGFDTRTRMSIILYHVVSEHREKPLHHYYLYSQTDKPPIFFIKWDKLSMLSPEALGPRYYHDHPNPERFDVIKAGKFMHEDRFVWVLEEACNTLGVVNSEEEIASMRQS